MKKSVAHTLGYLIPSRRLRHKFRSFATSYIRDHGKNNVIEYIKHDGTVTHPRRICGAKIRIFGNNNRIRVHQPTGKLGLEISVNHCTDITIMPGTTGSVRIDKPKSAPSTASNKIYIGNSSFGKLRINLLDGGGDITIGDNCMFSWDIEMRTSDGHTVFDVASGEIVNPNKDIVIGNHVWCGSDVTILKGTNIPENCVIGAHAIVTKQFSEPGCAIAGIPARVVKQNINWSHSAPSTHKNTVK